VDIDYLRIHAPRLLNQYDRAGQKAKYRGEIFPSDRPIGNYGMDSFELFQRDRKQNKKGIIAIDLVRYNLRLKMRKNINLLRSLSESLKNP
jgi:hypothetical protein